MKYEIYFKHYLTAIEQTLERVLPASDQYPSMIHETMRYAVFPGGKRFRSVLALASCEAAGGRSDQALLPAAAVELVHCYSLVHDDLPALDNDAERRGKPAVHKRFGENMAILAGDGLLTLAFHILANFQPARQAVQILEELSTAAGTYGMIGGQVADLITGTGKSDLSLPMIDYIHIHKTGKLIKAGAVCGAIAAGADKETVRHILRYGESLGLAFQSIDDLLDGDGYLRLTKPNEIRRKARDLIARAKRDIRPLGRKAEKLNTLADFLLRRLPKGIHVAVDQ